MGKQRLKIELLPGWIDCSDQNPEGPPTFLRETSNCPGPLQISHAEYAGGSIPNPTEDQLIELSKKQAGKDGWGEIVATQSGTCAFGIFGSAIYRSKDSPRLQIWHLSNGRDFIFVTHICAEEPDLKEIDEVKWIVKNVTLGSPTRPWWKFW